MPDVKAIIPTPVFDCPGSSVALPVRVSMVSVSGEQCLAFLTDNEKEAKPIDKEKDAQAVDPKAWAEQPAKCCEGC